MFKMSKVSENEAKGNKAFISLLTGFLTDSRFKNGRQIANRSLRGITGPNKSENYLSLAI